MADSLADLESTARIIRRDILRMIHAAGSGHPGGSLSAADFVTALYFARLRHNPNDPCWPDRDRVIFSKGHVAPVLYAALARCGYFPIDRLQTLRKLDSPLQGHPSSQCAGVEVGTGSLGQGLSVGVGLCLAAKQRAMDYRVYVILGDGELQEGQIWEAAMTAAHYRLDNLAAILDRNRLQIDGHTAEVMSIEPIADKWEAFGWHTLEVDGHDIPQLLAAFQTCRGVKERPSMIIAHTVKGKGVSIFEGKAKYHGVAPSPEEYQIALKELDNP